MLFEIKIIEDCHAQFGFLHGFLYKTEKKRHKDMTLRKEKNS